MYHEPCSLLTFHTSTPFHSLLFPFSYYFTFAALSLFRLPFRASHCTCFGSLFRRRRLSTFSFLYKDFERVANGSLNALANVCRSCVLCLPYAVYLYKCQCLSVCPCWSRVQRQIERKKETKRKREGERKRERENLRDTQRGYKAPKEKLRPPSVITRRSRQSSSVSRRLGMEHTLVSNAIDVHTDDNTF